MKKLLFFLTISSCLIFSCNKKESEHSHEEGSHQHADGSTHADHADSTAAQEEFTVGSDSTANASADSASKEKTHSHPHGDDDHKH